jgi:hypothetical protein
MSKCPWPGCVYEQDARLGPCYPHWAKLPQELRDNIWNNYREGWSVQPLAWRNAVKEAFDWIAEHAEHPEPPKPKLDPNSPAAKRLAILKAMRR